MSDTAVRAFIQARMSSKRFPGKVLAPLNGRPLVAHVISQVAEAIPRNQITVATSTEASDDPLAYYVSRIGIPVFRGPLHDVFKRFRLCLKAFPCDWFFRICSDSPMLQSELLQTMLQYEGRRDVDLVTNAQVRTFPIGHSAEMVNSKTFAGIDCRSLSDTEKEHVTRVYYSNPSAFSIVNIESGDIQLAETSWAVDTLADMHRLESAIADSG